MAEGYDDRLKMVIRGLINENAQLKTEKAQLKAQLAQAAQKLRQYMPPGGNYNPLYEDREKQVLRTRLRSPETFTPRQGRDRGGIEYPLVSVQPRTQPGISLHTDSNVMVPDGEEDWTDNE